MDRERPKFANDLGADLFISIHGNTYEDPGVSGTETYYYHENSLSLADIMQRHLVQASGFRDRGVKHEDCFVLKETDMPAALIEMGYVTNPQEEKAMLTEDVQSRSCFYSGGHKGVPKFKLREDNDPCIKKSF
ncbi:N-acetylmuramoyl-L-alanine amidase family protein [Paenibacillus eucommiae]|uniref:N-acetylmuramoyl-L-alanine amidase n=1 Tax=Paenibacillus eucommiae TaxID=1355755 RepID=A0ABS4JA71_9BACL|nr:N-acetylmuramoyl-L-alanine amidase [Paenibacillus eucommiae]MBP1996739.1 N-acetylmuramoyl-L-alanine amidase [Paenibacillus eucommiae]